MRTATFHIEGLSPYSFSKPHETPRLEKEGHDDYDKRTYLEKAHADPKTDEAFIPGTAFKFAIADAAKRLSIKIPGKRQQTYTKNMLAGIICFEPARLGVTRDKLAHIDVYAHANAVRGPGARVWRRFPQTVPNWKTTLQLVVIDDEIPNEIIERCVSEAGNLLGVGRFRPATGGFLGRWTVKSVKWS